MATTINEENPRKTLASDPIIATATTTTAENSVEKPPSPSADTAKDAGGAEELKASAGDPATVNSNDDGGSANDTQKKIRRAERFGMAVQLSEEEKRNSRASRFGTVSGSQGSSDATKKSEELKRKARAERFGTAKSVPSDLDEKKKARLARFAGVSSATDSVEEDKKKARALRFSGSQVNGKDKIEPAAAIAGKAGGGD